MTYASPLSPVALGIHVIDEGLYYLATNVEEVLKEIQERRFQVLEAPTGFENRIDSDLYTVQPSYAAGPDELTVTVTHVNDFSIFVQGLEVIKTATDTVVISVPAEGVYWIYYDSAGTLTASTVVFDFEDTTKVPVVVLYWDDDNSQVIYLGDERHSTVMDSSTHDLMHTTIGTRYQTGLTISGYTLSTDSNAAVSVGVAAGMIHDEDIAISIVDDATPDTYWEQDLSDPAKIPIFYRDGAAGNWRKIAATDYPFHPTGTGRLAYDNVGVGLAEGTNNYYIAYWIFATNDINNPIISIMGQREDNKITDAKTNNNYESLAFGTLPFQEMKVLYRIILQTKDAYTNAIKSTIEDVADYRALSTVATGTYVASSHSVLSDLSNDDHTQYLLADGTRALTGDWAVGAHAISGITTLGMTGQLTNTLAIGTPPFVIISTDKVVNLNVDMVDGYHLDQGVLIASTPTFGGLTINGAMVLNGAITGVNSITCDLGTSINEFSIDGTLAGNSDSALPTEKAVKTYVTAQVATVNSLAEILALGNEADGTNILLDQGADLIVYSDDKVTEVARIDGATGNITTLGTVDGVDVAALKTDVDGFNDELKDLTQVEIQQLENIDASTISVAQWGYLGALDQGLTQASSPTFVGLTLSGAITGITTLSMSGQLTSTLASGTPPFVISSTDVVANLNADLWDGNQFADYLNQAVKSNSSPSFVHLTFTTATFGTYIPYIVANTGIAPITMSQFGSLRRGVLQTLHPLTGEKDHFYLIDKQSAWTIASTGGTPSGENNMFNNQLDSNCLITVADLPYELTITYSATITATDVLYLEILGHRLSSGAFTLKEWKVEVRETAGSVWWTVLDRSGVTDPPNIAVPLWITGMDGVNYKYIDGIRLTITSADGSSWAPTEIYLAKLALINTRPSGTPAEAIGALDIVGGTVYGNVTIIGGDLTAANIVTAGLVDGVDVSAIVAFKTITGITNDVVADSLTDSLTLATANNLLTIVGTAATDTITFTVVEANISHDAIADVSADDHHAQSHALTTHSDVVLADPGADQIVFWDDSDSKFEFLVANTGLSIIGNNLNCDITQYTDGLARTACLEDDVYGVGWDADVTHAPTQNALYDKIAAMDILIAANTTVVEVEAVITAEIVGGQSIDNAIDALINTHNVANRHIDHSAVTITAGVGLSGGGTIAASRTIDCDITQYTDGLARTACLEDDVYGAGWDADVTHAPTQNAVYDKINAMDTLIAANTTVAEVEGIITAELVNGQSIDLAIDALINTHNAADNHVAHSGVTITAGAGMTGGGTIAATRTLNVIGGVGITVNADDIDCDITQYVDADAQAACVSDVVYGAGWDAVVDVAPSKNAVYDQLVTHYANTDEHHAQAHTHDGDTLQLDGINSDGGAFSFLTTGPITFNNALDGITTISAGGTYFQVDASGNVMLSVINADAGNPFRDSPTIELKAKYWTGAATADVAMLIGTDATGGAPNYDFFIKREDLTKIFSVDESGNGMVLGDFTVANLITAGSVDGVDISSIVAFKTITGITNNVVADGLTDTLTLSSANALLTIVGTTATDTIQWTVVEANFVLDGNTLQIDGINSDGGAFAFTTSGVVQFNNALAGITDLSMSGQLDMTGADVWIDLNPAATGTQDIISIVPTAALVAGSIWTGISQSLGPLDPAAGGVTIIRGFEIVANFLESDDGNLLFDAIVTNACPADDTNMFRANVTELTADKIQIGFLCDGGSKNLSATGTYQGLHIDWDGITRDLGAPVLQGARVQLPADYSNFGVSYAGYFSGDGRSVTICDTTYALNVSGAMNLVGAVTGITSLGVSGAIATPTTITTSGDITCGGDLTVSGGTIKTLTDNEGIYVGIGNDLRIYHSGTHSYITNSTGTLYLDNTGDNMSSNTVNWYFDLTASFVIRDRDDGDAEVFKLDTSARTLAIGNAVDTVATTMYGTLTVGTYTDIRGQYWQLFEPVNDGNPYWQLGSSAANDFYINTVYNSGVQTLDRVVFQSRSSAIGDGKMLFYPDAVLALSLHPTGNVDVAGDLMVGGGDIRRTVAGTTNSTINMFAGGQAADGAYMSFYGHSHANVGNIHMILNHKTGASQFRIYGYDGVSTWNSMFVCDYLGNVQFDGDLTVSGDDIKNSNGSIMISFSVGDVYIDGLAGIAADIDPFGVHKLYDMGIAALAWDECYADNWNNVSSWKTFADPLAALRTVGPIEDDEYAVDHSKIDDWLRSRIKAKAKNEKGFLKWEGGYVLKPEKAKTKARKVYVERLGKKVPVGNYLDGYSDEDFEHEDAYSINKTQIVMIQAIKQLEQRVKDLEAGS